MIAATDIRICSTDASFCIKEVDLAMCADVGTLQLLSKIVGNDSLVRELSLSGRPFGAHEAKDIGLVSRVVAGGQTEVVGAALALAREIAEKSPVATVGIKRNLNFSRDHSVDDSLDAAATWNGATIQTADIVLSLSKGTPPVFAKL